MKIAIIGAGGWVGGTLAREALARGHEVTAVVREPARLTLAHERLRVAQADATAAAGLAAVLRGHDLVIGSVSGRRDANNQSIPAAAQALLAAAAQAGAPRLFWVGGAGSLEVAPGVRLLDTPQFPPEYMGEALAGAEVLALFRAAPVGIDWIYISPPAILAPGERTGTYRVGGDQLLIDASGVSTISVDDYAVALIDEAERPQHRRQRIGVAY